MRSHDDRIARLSPEKRALLARRLSQGRAPTLSAPVLLKRRAGGDRPLSFSQQRLWFLDQLDPGSTAYTMPAAVRLSGALDVAALQRSLREIAARHEILRTTFVAVEGRPVQRVSATAIVELPLLDLQAAPPQEQAARVAELSSADARRPFDLSRGPLLRASLVRLAADQHVLLLNVHHIVWDAWSSGVFLRELGTLYRAFSAGEPSPLPDLPMQYADYAEWQRKQLQSDLLEAQLAYWRAQLSPEPPALELPGDRQRSAASTRRGARILFNVPAELSHGLTELARSERATLFMTLLAAYQALLCRYSGQDDIAVGTPAAGREHSALEGLIGFFVNTLVVRTDLSGDPSFRELLRRVRETCLGAFSHQALPFDMMVEAVRPHRDVAGTPFFRAIFDLDDAPPSSTGIPGLELAILETEPAAAKFDLRLSVKHLAAGLQVAIEYDADLFDSATIARMGGHFRELLEGAVAEPDRPIGALPLLTPAERRRVLGDWNDTARPFPRDRCVHALFQDQAALRPGSPAVLSDRETLTYSELERRANRLAHYLVRLGVRAGVPVGTFLERSPETVVAVLAVLKAGGAYLPLDLAYPRERLGFMLSDAAAPVIITRGPLSGALPAHDGRLVLLDCDGPLIEAEADSPPQSDVTAADLAYIMYTSGSTGVPKGVAVRHSSITRLVCGIEYAALGPESRVLHAAPLAFDASTFEIWGPLLNGGACVIHPEPVPSARGLGESIRGRGVTTAWLTSALFNAIVDEDPEQLSQLRELLTGGEALSVPHVRRALQALPGTQLINGYGPTESTTFTTCYRIPRDLDPSARSIPIGRPIQQTTVYVLDRLLEPVPVGVAGELYVGGEGLARGYHQRPDLTAERFVPNPFTPGEVMYRTGDRVRWLGDGDLEFMGRLDGQVKIRGFRIEPGEIEVALSRHPSLKSAVVVARAEESGERRLVAYVVPAPEAAPSQLNLRSFLRQSLPEYMVPSVFVPLEALPVTANGKVDREALPAPESPCADRQLAPRTPVEEILASIWSQLLGAERVGVDDDFFELGGHSLLATQIASRARRTFGVDVSVRLIFEEPTVARLAAAIERERRAGPVPSPAPIVRRAGEEPALSFAQQRLWFVEQLDPGTPLYNIVAGVRLRGKLEVTALGASLGEIVRRHEVLRTLLRTVAGRPAPVLAEPALTLSTLDLRSTPEGAREASAIQLAREEGRRPFDIARGPLVRAQLLRLREDEHWLVLTLHHVVADRWSVSVLIREVAALYRSFLDGAPNPLDALCVQYADYACWQRDWLQGAVLEQQLDYWKKKLSGAPPFLELPTDRPRPPVQTSNGCTHPFLLPPELARGLTALSRSEGATLFMTLLAGFKALLQRYSGQDDICVGTPIANRTRAEVEDLIGFFVNTLVLRTDLSGDPSFRELVGRVRETALDAYAHQDVPFEKVVDAVQPERALSHTPLFQVMFDVADDAPALPDLPGLSVSALEIDSRTSKFDLTFDLRNEPHGLVGAIEYNTDLFDASTIERLAGHFRVLLEAAVADPDRHLSELPLLGEGERRRVVDEWNETGAGFPRDRCLHELFEAQADRRPGAVAVVCGGEQLSYRELDHRASQLALHLRALGVGPDVPVGLCLERSPEMVVGLLGVLKAGGAYLPLDPADPQGRLAFALQDSGAKVVLTQARHAARLAGEGRQLVRLDADWEVVARREPARIASGATPENLAYVIYTSGSTGKPKGVLVPHRAVVNHGTAIIEAFGLGPSDRVLQFASIAFDASVEEVFPTLWSGACLVLRPPGSAPSFPELHRLIGAEGLTVLDLPTAYWQAWVSELTGSGGGLPPSLRLVVVGGEKVSASSVADWQRVAGSGCAWMNTYGPTETTVTATLYAPRGAWAGSEVPIGRPIANLRAYVLDPHRQPVPVGVPGELYLGGAGLARGYLNRPELTAERFVPDAFSPHSGARMYRTGDRARWRDDGQLEYLGRLDDQVKVRGFRIELGEVESVLAQHPAVREVVAAVREEGEARRLVAYVVPREAGQPPQSGELREFLRERLPEYMVPSAFVALEALPFTRNGKVDRKALPAPEPQERGPQELVGPRTPAEEVLAQIWAQLLGRERVGIHDNFFELGGDSILSIQIVSRAQQAGLHLTPRQIFEFPTVAGLAAVAATQATAQAEQGVVTGDLPLTPIQRWFFEEELTEPHHFNQSVLLTVRGALARPALEAALVELVGHHDALRLRFERDETGWRQENAAVAPEARLLRWEDLSTLPQAEQPQAVERICAEVQRSLDLGQGNLLRAAYFDLGADRTGRLLLVVHHLAVDGVSWRILLEDLETAYGVLAAGRPLTFPPKTTSFRDWARALADHARSPQLRDELPFWIDSLAGSETRLPVDFPEGSNTEASAESVTVELSAEETQGLLQEVPQAYHTEVNDVLLTALAQALSRWTGQAAVAVELEGHGREEISERLDLSRTVGWFTTTYPVRLDLSSAARGPGDALLTVKEALRRVPRRGLGYGLLRHLDGEARAKLGPLPPPQVSFNYLGQMGQVLGSGGPFALAAEPRGAERDRLARRCHLLEVTGAVLADRLQLEWRFSRNLHRRDTVSTLAAWFVEALRRMLAHCRSPDAGGHSPSDFALAGLDQRTLERVLARTGRKGGRR